MNFTSKQLRLELKEMGADADDPRAKALDRIEARQIECLTQTNEVGDADDANNAE